MTKEEHIKKHIELHKALDELMADWLNHQPLSTDKRFFNTSITELAEWSFRETINPTEKDK